MIHGSGPNRWSLTGVLMGCLLVTSAMTLAAAQIYPTSRTQKQTGKQQDTEPASDVTAIIATLDQLLKDQEALLQTAEDIKRELAIVKIRATER